ncbi:MAG: hypothetical protein PHF67_00895 [Candidatus Nanoarchaeia archaeon]|nr:hypothetical protein [Candidatus Nanoarchaeia archaeon]
MNKIKKEKGRKKRIVLKPSSNYCFCKKQSAIILLACFIVMVIVIVGFFNLSFNDNPDTSNISQINIIKAEHFDSSRTSLRDITDSVIQKDDLWSLVNPGEYVRAYFEKNLTNKNDITLFAKSISMDGSKIEVYNKDSNDLIAVFNKIGKESNYKTYLRGIPDGESYDAFDLKVLNNPVQFDYITDPETPPILSYNLTGNITVGGGNNLGFRMSDDRQYLYYLINNLAKGGSNYQAVVLKLYPNNGSLIKNISYNVDSNSNEDSRAIYYYDSGYYVVGDFNRYSQYSLGPSYSGFAYIQRYDSSDQLSWQTDFKHPQHLDWGSKYELLGSSMDSSGNIYLNVYTINDSVSPSIINYTLNKYSPNGSKVYTTELTPRITTLTNMVATDSGDVYFLTKASGCNATLDDINYICLMKYSGGTYSWNITYYFNAFNAAEWASMDRMRFFNNSIYGIIQAGGPAAALFKFDLDGNPLWNISNGYTQDYVFDKYKNLYVLVGGASETFVRKLNESIPDFWNNYTYQFYYNVTTFQPKYMVIDNSTTDVLYFSGTNELAYHLVKFAPNDTTPPIVNITYPVNGTHYDINVSTISYSYSDDNPGYCWYTIDAGGTNSSIVSAGTSFSDVISIEGSNTWSVTCNDTNGYIGSSTVTFIKDLTPPDITFNCTPTSVNVSETISCSCTATDSLSTPSVSYTANPSTLTSGSFSTTCTATDNAGNSNSSSVSYSVVSSSTADPNSGGYGSGGTSVKSKSCIPKFVCSQWSSCTDNIQTRTCSDSCTSKVNIEKQNCSSAFELLKISRNCSDLYLPESNEKLGSVCTSWSRCNAIYGLKDVLNNNLFLNGQQSRTCLSKKGLSFEKRFCDSICEAKSPLIRKVVRCSKEYVEIYDSNKQLISRLELVNGRYKQLNINLDFMNSNYCDYCYDKVKNYDEDGVDCSNKIGGNCPICKTPINCYKDLDCAPLKDSFCKDSKSCIAIPKCLNPGTVKSKCSYQERCTNCISGCENGKCLVKCNSDLDCGKNDFIGDKFCKGRNVYQLFADNRCYYPGSINSKCSSRNFSILIESCKSGCENGKCIKNFTEVCSKNDDCGISGYHHELFCRNNYVIRNYTNFICLLNKDLSGYCSNSTRSIIWQVCSYNCKDGKCIDKPICTIDNDCKSKQICLSGKCKNITCSSDSECEDNNPYTEDKCSNPNTLESFCMYDPIKCIKNSDCGKDVYGDVFCSDNLVVNNHLVFKCNGKGSKSYCTNSTNIEKRQTCPDGCLNGICIDIVCKNDFECDDNNSYTEDKCLNQNTLKSFCVHNEIKCIFDSDCGESSSKKYCLDSQICSANVSYYCNNSGTINSKCIIRNLTECIICENQCRNDSCIPFDIKRSFVLTDNVPIGDILPEEHCISELICNEWSECRDGIRTKSCVNSCTRMTLEEWESCDINEIYNIKPEIIQGELFVSKYQFNFICYLLLIMGVLLFCLALILLANKNKIESGKKQDKPKKSLIFFWVKRKIRGKDKKALVFFWIKRKSKKFSK